MKVTPGAPVPAGNEPRGWPFAYEWAIDQIACPAFCCTPAGSVLYSNASARRLWGRAPDAAQTGRWHGFAAVYDEQGGKLEGAASPAALAASTGAAQAPAEFITESFDGQRRRLVIHARPILDAAGGVAGVLCSLTDVSERRRLEQEVLQADAQRDAFLRILAHELRNPLAPIMSVAQAMRRATSEPGLVRMAAIVERQTRQLAQFITDLLDASRIAHAGDIPITMRRCSVGEVVNLACDVAIVPIQARGQTLRIDTGEPTVTLLCDPGRVAQALGNGLLNASAYSDDGAEIALSVTVDGVLLEIEVLDRGIGVAPQRLAELFQPFFQLDHHPARVQSGAGLGLAIARSVCEAHGGMVSAHSAGPDQGLRLRFVLPVVDMTAPVAA